MAFKEIQCPHCNYMFHARLPERSHYQKLPPEEKKRVSARTAVHAYLGKVIRDELGIDIDQSRESVDAWLRRKVGWDGAAFIGQMRSSLPDGRELSEWVDGELQIDHKRPFSLYRSGDFKTDIREAFDIDNLRMITKAENLGRNKVSADA